VDDQTRNRIKAYHGGGRTRGVATCCGHLYDMIEGNVAVAAWPGPHPLGARGRVACELAAAGGWARASVLTFS
jgi:hypothetical protein